MPTLQNLFDKSLHRMASAPPGHDFLTVVDYVVRAIDRRLLDDKSDLLRTDYSATLGVGDQEVTLPVNMLGLAFHPVLSKTPGQRIEVTPIPDEKRHSWAGNGTPEHYEVLGAKLRFYPPADEAVTVYYSTWNRTSVSSMADEVPYGGLFDDVILELVIRYGANPALAASDPALEMLARRGVDDVLAKRRPKDIRFLYTW